MKRIDAVSMLVFYNKSSLGLVWSLGQVCFSGLVCVLVLMLLLGGAGVLLGDGVPFRTRAFLGAGGFFGFCLFLGAGMLPGFL